MDIPADEFLTGERRQIFVRRVAQTVTAHEAALLRHPELVEQIKADRIDPTSAVRSKARRPC